MLLIEVTDVDDSHFVFRIVAFDRLVENLFLRWFQGDIIVLDGRKIHRENEEVERFF